MPITVREVTSKDDVDALLKLPHRLYANDPNWVAPILMLERRRLNANNPFFEDAKLKLFLAEKDGVVAGSISVLQDKKFNANQGARVVWFGYFETIEDPDVGRALLERAEAQARAWGGDVLRGPRNLTRFEYMGLTVEGHHRLPPMFQGQHPAYYQAILDDSGFAKHHDVLAYETPLVDDLGRPRELPEGLRRKADGCRIPGLEIRRVYRRQLTRDLVTVHEVLNDAYRTVPDVSPMPQATFVNFGRAYLGFVDPHMVQIATVNGQPAGFAVCMPEINEALVAARGRVLPLGWLRVALAMRQVHTAAFKLIGVTEQWRGTGLHARLIAHVIDGARKAGYTRLDGSVIDERNKPMRAVVEHAGCTIYRRYRVFEKAVD